MCLSCIANHFVLSMLELLERAFKEQHDMQLVSVE